MKDEAEATSPTSSAEEPAEEPAAEYGAPAAEHVEGDGHQSPTSQTNRPPSAHSGKSSSSRQVHSDTFLGCRAVYRVSYGALDDIRK